MALSACSSDEIRDTSRSQRTEPSEATLERTFSETPSERGDSTTADKTEARPDSGENPVYGYTYGRPSGNRVVEGSANLRRATPVDIPLAGTPTWVVGAAFGDGVAWTVALENGRTQTFALDDAGEIREMDVRYSRLPAGEPPLLKSEGDSLELVLSLNGPESDLTHSFPVSESELSRELVGIQNDGELFSENSSSDSTSIGTFGVTALRDARITASPDGELAVLSDPTERYPHGVLGDETEAGSMTVAERVGLENMREILPESGGVFEGIAPLWFEDEGGRDLLAVTESVIGAGSRVSVYAPDGSLVSAGPFVEEDFKWRHVLAARPFGPDGETEIAVVRTPHVAPVVEFYRIEDDQLRITAEVPGYTSHRIYTRNLDTAISGDLDSDGNLELLVPNATYTELAAIRRDGRGASVSWRLDSGGEISTNVGSATDDSGDASIAVGRSDGTLRIWAP